MKDTYKGIIFVALMTLMIGGGIAYYLPQENGKLLQVSATEEIAKSWKTYENSEYGISFSYPPDWRIKEQYTYVYKGEKIYNFQLVSPSRNDIEANVGVSAHYMLAIGETNTSTMGGFATDKLLPGQQAPWNVYLGDAEKQTPEYTISQKIIASIRRTSSQ